MENALFRIILMIVFVTVAIVAFCYYIFYYSQTKSTEAIMNELKQIPLEEDHLNSIKSEGCKELEKNESTWIVKDCNDDIYFKIFLEEGGYTLGRCVKWEVSREAFLKLKDQLPIKDCVNQQAEDKLVREFDSFKVYEVCGLRLVFRDECIVGVGRL